MAKLFRRRSILAKAESTYSTDPTPTGTANYIQVKNLSIEPIVADEVERDFIRPYLGNYEVLLANQRVNVTFDVEMSGSGSAGTAPKYGAILKACGLTETITGGNTVTYAPDGTPTDSVTIHVNIDGVRHIVKGCRGSFSINCSLNEIPTISFTMQGIFTTPTDQAVPTVTTSNQAAPLIFKNGSTSNFSIFGFAAALQSWSLDFNNETDYRELVGGTKEVILNNRAPSGTVQIENIPLATKNYFTAATDNLSGNNTFQHGQSDGNKITVSMPKANITAPAYASVDDIDMLDLAYTAVPNSGNDEVSLVFA